MGLFTSREQRELQAAMTEVKDFFDAHFKDWDRALKLTIGAQRASEFPVEKIEPVIRGAWVEAYARGIIFGDLAEKKYEELSRKYSGFSTSLPLTDYRSSVSFQLRKFGGLVGNLVFEIGKIEPDYLEVLEKHLEEPEISKIQQEAKLAVNNRKS